jgi:hypothetical protein
VVTRAWEAGADPAEARITVDPDSTITEVQGRFFANAAWLLIAALAHNLVRWVAALGMRWAAWWWPRRSVAGSLPCRADSPAPIASSPCICRRTGRGPRASCRCSPDFGRCHNPAEAHQPQRRTPQALRSHASVRQTADEAPRRGASRSRRARSAVSQPLKRRSETPCARSGPSFGSGRAETHRRTSVHLRHLGHHGRPGRDITLVHAGLGRRSAGVLRTLFKPCVRFSLTRLTDTGHRSACAAANPFVPLRR